MRKYQPFIRMAVKKYSMGSSESVFDDRIINIGLWPHSPNLKPCNQYFTRGAC